MPSALHASRSAALSATGVPLASATTTLAALLAAFAARSSEQTRSRSKLKQSPWAFVYYAAKGA